MAHIIDRFEEEYAILLKGDVVLEVRKTDLAEGMAEGCGRNKRQTGTHCKKNECPVGIRKERRHSLAYAVF